MIEPRTLHPDKVETIRQWDNDPCGLLEGLAPDDPAYWLRVEANRYQAYAPWIRSTLGFNRYPGRRVLEVGFGLGTDLMQFARAGSEVYGIDLVPRHIELARRRFRAFHMRARLARADVECLPYASESFDVVYSFGVLHHTPDMRAALREIYRVLRTGGVLIMAVYHRDSLQMAWKVVVEGLLQRRLFSMDWRKFMSRIEQRDALNTAAPLVRVYSRSALRRLLSPFAQTSIMVQHGFSLCETGSEGCLKRTAKRMLNRVFASKVMVRRFGWYLIATATK